MIALALMAKNSSGDQLLYFYKQEDGTTSPTLVGRLDGKEIQVDFEGLTDDDLDDFIAYLQRVRDRKAGGDL